MAIARGSAASAERRLAGASVFIAVSLSNDVDDVEGRRVRRWGHRYGGGTGIRRAADPSLARATDAREPRRLYGGGVERSIRHALGSARVRPGADVGLAVGLAVVALVDLALSADATSWGGRGPVQVCLALACTIPLAWRVHHPITTVAVITAAGGLLVAVAAPHQAPFEVFIGSVLASYSIGAHTSGGRRWL